MFNIDKILGKKKGKKFKPVKETIIADKPVHKFNNYPIPKNKTIKSVYDKLPDDTNIPLQFMTRKQYIKKYIKNQENKNNIDFSKNQEQAFINKRMPHYSNIVGRYTTKDNPYYPPAVVVFNDPNNLKNIKGEKFKKLAMHEYGHELAEKNDMNMSKIKEEKFADNVTEYGKTNKIFKDNKAVNYALHNIQQDGESKNMHDDELLHDMLDVMDKPEQEINRMRQSDIKKSESTLKSYKDINKREFEGLSEQEREQLQNTMNTYNKELTKQQRINTIKGQMPEGEYEYRNKLSNDMFGVDYIDLSSKERSKIGKLRITRDGFYKSIPENIEQDNESENKLFGKKPETYQENDPDYPIVDDEEFVAEQQEKQSVQDFETYGDVKSYSGKQVGNTLIAADTFLPSGKVLTLGGLGARKYVDKVKFVKTDEHDSPYKIPKPEVHFKSQTNQWTY